MAKDRAAHAMGGGKKPSKKSKKSKKSKVHKMHIRRTANGGYLAEHHSMPDEMGQTAPMEEHSLPDIQSLQDHVGEHMGPQQEGEPRSKQAAAPQAAPRDGLNILR
jgi:hypothetical protein